MSAPVQNVVVRIAFGSLPFHPSTFPRQLRLSALYGRCRRTQSKRQPHLTHCDSCRHCNRHTIKQHQDLHALMSRVLREGLEGLVLKDAVGT